MMKKVTVWLVGLTFGVMSAVAGAADLGKFARQSQSVVTKTLGDGRSSIELVWWIPYEYWETVFEATQNVDPNQKKVVLGILKNINILAIVDGVTGLDGSMNSRSWHEISKGLTLALDDKRIKQLDPDTLDPNVTAIVNTIKPLVRNMLGQLGKGIRFIVFEGADDKGEQLIDATMPGLIKVTLDGRLHTIRLPLAVLMPDKMDPKTLEVFPGTYNFNPYTGAKLTEKPAQ